MRVVFRAEAAEDVALARNWYEDQRSGLGDEFIRELEGVVVLVADLPRAFPFIREGVRRALLHRFPYALYYRLSAPDLIEVIACLHMRSGDRGEG